MRPLSVLLPCLALIASPAIAAEGQTTVGADVHVDGAMNIDGISLQSLEERISALERAVRAISPTALLPSKGSAR